ncbi:hypothetical protein QTJ16_004606 [Diplocarpon rosae]|uniref:Uncharacterized protein n=1 Tax=Diplocarpon rosae TaxID=946125 RepID=A0AAD9WEU7_9HELO|nr:hypothetical protein QTJ16_004606 [Diplocarpon rosae]
MSLTDEELRRAIKYLLVKKRILEDSALIDSNENIDTTTDLDDTTSSTPSIFTEEDNRSECSAATTSYSSNFHPHLANYDPYNSPAITMATLDDLVEFVAIRVDWAEFLEVLQVMGIPAGEQEILSYRHLALDSCPESGNFHEFEANRRCVRCYTQLCKSCEECILTSWRVAPDPTKVERKDTLAARKLLSTCKNHQIGLRSARTCLCNDFLMKPTHDCEDGVGHMCRDCARGAKLMLEQPNAVAYEAFCGDTEPVQHVHAYSCGCGDASDLNLPTICKICLGMCIPYMLNQKTSADGEISYEWFNFGWEKLLNAGFINGTCPWVKK